MNFIKSLQKLTQNKKVILYAFVFLIAFYLLNDSTFAADASGLDFQQTKEKVASVSDGLLSWISVILALFMYLSTIFLSPAWINGSLFWLNWYFKDIWILVSNLVYFIFAFILIWIAFMNIIWRNADQYQLKQALPKFIVWVLIVPFSWFLVQFILSLSAVLTVASLSLPFETFETYHQTMEWVKVPTDCTLDLRSKTDKTAASNGGQVQEWYFHCKEWKEVSLNELGWNADAIDSIFWIIAMYNYWVLWLDRTDWIDNIDMENVKNFWDLVVKIVFDLLFVFVYSILMIAIWVVLMVRWIYIWIYIMISPVFWLMYFFDKKDWWWDWFFAKFNVKEFIALAMVPVYTMLALSFWLLFLFIVWTGMTTSSTQSQSWWWVSVANNKVEVWKFTLNIEWQVSKMANSTNLLKQIWNDTLWIVWSLILKVFGIVILWWAVMAALRTSDITKVITQPLHDFWSQVWKIMTSAPTNIPIFGWQSMNSMNTIWQKAAQYYTTKESERGAAFMKEHNLFQDWYWDMKRNADSARNTTSHVETKNLIEKSLKDMNWNEELLQSEEFKKMLENIALNSNSWANQKFRDFMLSDDMKKTKTLTKDQANTALWNLEDSNINLEFNKDTIWIWNKDALVKYIRWLKEDNKNSSPWTAPVAPTNQVVWSVTPWVYDKDWIKVTINNNNRIEWVTNNSNDVTINEAIKNLELNSLTKAEFVKNLTDNNVSNDEANRIANAIWNKFKPEQANP